MKPREWTIICERAQIGDSNNYEIHQLADGIAIKRNEKVKVIEKSAYDQLAERLRVLGDYAKSILEKYPAECAHGNGYSLLGQLAQQVATEAQILVESGG